MTFIIVHHAPASRLASVARETLPAPAEPLSGLFHATASPLAFCCTRSAACNSRTAFRPLPRASKSPALCCTRQGHSPPSEPLSSLCRTSASPLASATCGKVHQEPRTRQPITANSAPSRNGRCQPARARSLAPLRSASSRAALGHEVRRREGDALAFTKARRLSSCQVLPQ